jgi:dihydrofolate synthase/folylpolyglutamate synthase
MNYSYLQALQFLRRRDDWERTGSADAAARWDLRRMRSLLNQLENPHLGRTTAHIAGSKGKGTTAAMIAAGLRAAHQRAGLYTSPHLHRFVERIAVDGEPIAEDSFARLTEDLAAHIQTLEDDDGSPGTVSTFEALTALAFIAFRGAAADVQVLEVGLGGRLDATNVFEEKAVCVITPVGLEHTEILGDTIPQIAGEKAGIITPGATVVMAPQRESAADVIRAVCREKTATLIEVAAACAMSPKKQSLDGQEFTLKTPNETYNLNIPFIGRHQLENAATAVLALEALAASGLDVTATNIREGLVSARWPCRIEVLKRKPLVIADGAHDKDSARRLTSTLKDDLGLRDVALVIGSSRGKDIVAIAEELAPIAGQVFVTRSRHPRSMDPREITLAFQQRDVPTSIEKSVAEAMEAALAAGGPVVACGSLFIAAEAREHVLGVAYDPALEPAEVGA